MYWKKGFSARLEILLRLQIVPLAGDVQFGK
jgi:hypothetical protein